MKSYQGILGITLNCIINQTKNVMYNDQFEISDTYKND